MAPGSIWSNPLQDTLACLVGALVGALAGGWLGGPLLAFVGAIFGCACAAEARRAFGASARRPARDAPRRRPTPDASTPLV